MARKDGLALKLTPISRISISDAIVEQIETLIAQGELKEGQKLPSERELAEEFSVGRASVREALKVLESLGLVKRTSQGTFVENSSPSLVAQPFARRLLLRRHTVHELIEARRTIEEDLAQLAAQRADEQDICNLEEAVHAMDEDSGQKWVEAEVYFHSTLAEAAHNRILSDVFEIVRNLMLSLADGDFEGPGKRELSKQEHLALIEAIKERDPEAARRLMAKHLDLAEGIWVDALQEK
ncbi:MAG TPA: FadR family transcriptional regulator [Firmicutes bacterium]|nr:FadR family transcriptional regulator [Bacillota bacterium]